MSFFKKILNIFPSHIIYLLILLYFSLIFIAFLEMIGIGAIPVFLTVFLIQIQAKQYLELKLL